MYHIWADMRIILANQSYLINDFTSVTEIWHWRKETVGGD